MLLRRYHEVKAVKKTADIPNEQEEQKQEKRYIKSDISRMSTADLKTLAPTLGIEVTEESTGAKLKKEIVEKLGL